MIRRVLVAAALAFACGHDTPDPLRVEPPSVELAPRAQAAFAATSATTVTWSVREAAGGTVTAAGVYTAPAAPGVYHVVATAGGVSAEAVVTVKSPVTIAAPASFSTPACDPLQLTATVTGSTDTGVIWTVPAVCGTVTAGGVFTSVRGTGDCVAVAQARADPSVSATTTISVLEERVLSVAVTPASTVVAPGGTVQFTAAVTTSCGTFPAGS